MRISILLAFLLVFPLLLLAQAERGNQGTLLTVNMEVGSHTPGGDLSDRFGNHGSVGLGTDLMLPRTNLILGLGGQFLFGTNVKTDVLRQLRTSRGSIISNNRGIADVQLRMRGFYLGGRLGKLFGIFPGNPRSGIRLTLGAGLLQHKIRIQDDPQAPVAALADDYKKGYDRLTYGFSLQQFIGYQHLSKNRRINFYLGIEATQGFTQGRRTYNFDTMESDTGDRTDTQLGIRLGWILPFYFTDSAGEILY